MKNERNLIYFLYFLPWCSQLPLFLTFLNIFHNTTLLLPPPPAWCLQPFSTTREPSHLSLRKIQNNKTEEKSYFYLFSDFLLDQKKLLVWMASSYSLSYYLYWFNFALFLLILYIYLYFLQLTFRVTFLFKSCNLNGMVCDGCQLSYTDFKV